MAAISVTVDDRVGGQRRELSLDADLTAAQALALILEALELPAANFSGRDLRYKLLRLNPRRRLQDRRSLAQEGVGSGDTLRLVGNEEARRIKRLVDELIEELASEAAEELLTKAFERKLERLKRTRTRGAKMNKLLKSVDPGLAAEVIVTGATAAGVSPFVLILGALVLLGAGVVAINSGVFARPPAAPPREFEEEEEPPEEEELDLYSIDSDEDGLSDGEEEDIGTNRFDPDTDSDGLWDGDEWYEVGTDPLNFDTDGDGYSDGEEVLEIGSDPFDPFDPDEGDGDTGSGGNCTDNSQYAGDVTIKDGTMLQAGEYFVKTWAIRNSGSCIWDSDYFLVLVDGHPMSSPEAVSVSGVSPGETVEVSVEMFAPEEPGAYVGRWRIINGQGQFFGQTPYVSIVVEEAGPPPAPKELSAQMCCEHDVGGQSGLFYYVSAAWDEVAGAQIYEVQMPPYEGCFSGSEPPGGPLGWETFEGYFEEENVPRSYVPSVVYVRACNEYGCSGFASYELVWPENSMGPRCEVVD